ncbi:MAG: NAD(P)/FAD-dependent oxidoreductase [Chloroflexi bacterium]|nr:NAD(P)/FAD-dependent oxidoreductase [Chloroflexota bacterium]
MSGKTVLILGGGVGGLVAANELRQRLPREHRIVLVEKNAQHTFAPSFLWLMTGDRQPARITREVRQLVRPGVEVVIDSARAIDLASQRVETSAQTLNYDYLIVALGAELAPEAIPGLDTVHTFYTFEGAGKLRDALRTFNSGQVAVVVSALPYKCPGAPHEGAMLIADSFRRRGIRDKVQVHLFTPEPQPMPVAGPTLGDAVKQMLAGKGVVFHPLHKLTAVNPTKCELAFDGKEPFKYDLLVAIPPHRGPQLVREAGLTNEAGWIPVDRATLRTKYENVHALGDVTAISIPGRWKPDVPMMLPKAGVFAHAQAQVVARRIAAEIMGAPAKETFCGEGYCMLEAGEDLAGFAFGNFFGEPSPQVKLRQMGRAWHWGKVLFEQWWLAPQGLKRETLRLALTLGSKGLGIPSVI